MNKVRVQSRSSSRQQISTCSISRIVVSITLLFALVLGMLPLAQPATASADSDSSIESNQIPNDPPPESAKTLDLPQNSEPSENKSIPNAEINPSPQEAKEFAPIEIDPAANAAQMVLIVEFSDTPRDELGYDEPYPYAENMTRFQRLQRDLNGVDSQGRDSWLQDVTFRHFIYTISDGKQNTVSYFPQMYSDSTMLHIYSSLTAAQYSSNTDLYDAQLIGEAIQQLNAARPDLNVAAFDRDDLAGSIDNLLVIPALKGREYDSSNFSSHAGTTQDVTAGVTNGQKSIFRYTVVSGGVDSDMAIDSFYASTAAHEYLHTLYFADLYRYTSNGSPVGLWDIMSKAQWTWPLAYPRQQQGWTSISTVNLNDLEDQYTLHAPDVANSSNGTKDQALIIKPAISSSEYFVVEYRQRNSTSSFERAVPESGLIVYRVNETLKDEGNKYGNDFIYIFRPDETGINNSEGDIDRAAICAGAYTSQNGRSMNSSIGSLDLNATITDGAICYSNNTNSGLKITALSQEDDNITFKIEVAEDTEGAKWDAATNQDGSSPFGQLIWPRTSTATDGTNFFATAEDMKPGTQKCSVYKYDGATWTQIGSDLSDMRYVSLSWFDGELYAFGSNANSTTAILQKYSDGRWRTVASVAADNMSESSCIEVIGRDLYMITDNYGTDLHMYKLNGSSFQPVGGELPINNSTSPIIIDLGGSPAIVSGETGSSLWSTNLYRLNGSSWTKSTQLISNSAINSASYAKLNDKTYVYVNQNNTPQLFTFTANGTLEKSDALSGDIDATAGGSLCASSNSLYLAAASSEKGVYVYSLRNGDISELIQLGDKVYSGCFGVHADVVGKQVYAAIPDNTATTVSVRYHALVSDDEQPSLIDKPILQYRGHVQDIGWQKNPLGGDWMNEGEAAGTSGKALRVEALDLQLQNRTGISGGILYRGHVENEGWQDYQELTTSGDADSGFVKAPKIMGTEGKALRVEAIELSLTGELADKYSIYYRTHAQDVGWTNWVKDGAMAGTAGLAKRLEAIEVKIIEKDSLEEDEIKFTIASTDAPGAIDTSTKSLNGAISYNATMHIQDIGNKDFIDNTGSANLGTTGQAKRVEALTLSSLSPNVNIEYTTHIQDIGWERDVLGIGWRTAGQKSGTSGQAKRLEAIQIRLTGDDASKYDVYYRTHIQDIGWTGWAKNGQSCGSAGYAYRMEAMQIVFVPKGGTAPGMNTGYFYQR